MNYLKRGLAYFACSPIDWCARSPLGYPYLVLSMIVLLSGKPVFADTYAVIVTGLGGTEEYSESFSGWSDTFQSALGSLDDDEALIINLSASAERQDILDAIALQAKAIDERAALEGDQSQSELTGGESTFVLMLIGHGTANSNQWRFNIKGPDLTTEDLVAALNKVNSNRQLVVLASSASGATLEALGQEGRVVITATKSGGEINAVRFPEFFAQAMLDGAADYDRNEILTVAEAYRFAEGRTREYYEREKLLASEHSRLRGEGASDIALALLGSLQNAKDDPVVTALLDERLVLEQAFNALKRRKPEMPVDDYYTELEALLISIASLQKSIDQTTGWSDDDADS